MSRYPTLPYIMCNIVQYVCVHPPCRGSAAPMPDSPTKGNSFASLVYNADNAVWEEIRFVNIKWAASRPCYHTNNSGGRNPFLPLLNFDKTILLNVPTKLHISQPLTHSLTHSLTLLASGPSQHHHLPTHSLTWTRSYTSRAL